MQGVVSEGKDLDDLPLSRVAGQFLRFLCAHGMRVPREITAEQAERDAVEIIERAYRGPAGEGFDAMLVDYESQGHQAVSLVTAFLANAVKQSELQRHMRWVLNGVIDPMDRNAQRDLVCLLYETAGEHLPPFLTNGNPEDFVDCLPRLLVLCEKSRNEVIRQLRGV